MADILFELGCEELPPKALYGLSEALYKGVCKQLDEAGFTYDDSSRWYASPRRLAFQLNGINEQLADKESERRGPAVAAAFDDDGHAKPAAMGFARSLGVTVADLSRIETDKGEYLTYQVLEKGMSIEQVLPEFIEKSIKQLPIPKPMRWGNNDYSFIRPVHWMVLLINDQVIPMELFGVQTGNQSLGHRFHHNEFVTISHAQDYVQTLQAAHIMVDQDKREVLIAEQVQVASAAVNGVAMIGASLLSEVSSIVEKPVAVLGDFSKDFLSVPKEALISSMEKHQKYFSVVDNSGELMPYFVALANIDSSNPVAVKKGFEKVITPRLADARFFWEKDKARPLTDNIPLLEKMVFEKSLGTLADKTNRIAELLLWMAPLLGFDQVEAKRAALLMKTDLMSDMVDEFPDLQGLMGGYYAAAQGESIEVSKAIRDQYLPKFVGDQMPETTLGQAVSVADKIDTFCGIFAVGKKPTGSKDPFALRRAALSVINILKDKDLHLNYSDLIAKSLMVIENDRGIEVSEEIKTDVHNFFDERLRNQFINSGYSHDVFNAANALVTTTLTNLENRLIATEEFKQQDYAKSLIEANKRSVNIIAKANLTADAASMSVDTKLFESTFENELYHEIEKIRPNFESLVVNRNYTEGYELLASLAEPLDQYFEHVMVNDENPEVRKNRLAQLAQFSRLTSSIADLSELVKG
ncbi:glycine--tRNA ligase subunit beta [Marinicella litoralis]|uniref:Glycine--tRNA ligase beta subunit n=1 Tax=Marinicella litoralis TaxID=644220 RepID=A0A4R6XTR5_9GAMM|nr:glycine--tRNA ligase subunit beta [Marinicella litoralis]TDR23166.1 glycyl-tRNA synthetase beta chain [Marinicella litoralis]